MKIFNVVVTAADYGPAASFVRTLTEHVFNSPEQVAAGGTGKPYSIEFGRLEVRPDIFLYLAGVPADENLRFIWERLAGGLLGFIVVFDAEAKSTFAATTELIAGLKDLTDTPFVVFFSGSHDVQYADVAVLKKTLGIPKDEQIVSGKASDPASAKQALISLIGLGAKLAKKVSA